MPLRADPSADPPHVDLLDGSLPIRGVYRRDGDMLIWTIQNGPGPRPPSLEPAPGVTVWTLRRVKK
jgi:hypothetical protein